MTCPECDGDGVSPCADCDGTGRVTTLEHFDYPETWRTEILLSSDCDACDGTGNVPCPECDGNGNVRN